VARETVWGVCDEPPVLGRVFVGKRQKTEVKGSCHVVRFGLCRTNEREIVVRPIRWRVKDEFSNGSSLYYSRYIIVDEIITGRLMSVELRREQSVYTLYCRQNAVENRP
jgi:hypothetical protein